MITYFNLRFLSVPYSFVHSIIQQGFAAPFFQNIMTLFVLMYFEYYHLAVHIYILNNQCIFLKWHLFYQKKKKKQGHLCFN